MDHSAANLTAFMGVLYSGNFYVPVDSQMPPPRMKAMTSKQWLALFCATVLCLGACVVGFNWLADPFGVFTHKALEWPSYEMTLNPRTAKITYLKEHHQEYDSYILGCSSTSSFPTEQLNEYLDASFYNMIMYGADMLDVEQDAVYLLENYEVKNLVVNVYLDNACVYDQVTNPLSYSMPPETTGESAAAFYARYLFMDPRHSLDKLKAMGEDTYLTQSFDVFNEVTGAYDKKVRDAEAIGSLEQYYESYPIFADYPEAACFTDEDAITGTLESLTRIRDLRAAQPQAEESCTAQVPVFLYHQIDPQAEGDISITPEHFEAQIAALAEAGYTAVLPEDLQAYVNQGKALPEKPILITFDDGYLSNYEYAWPILEKYGMKATIFVIGSTVGNTEHYKDTDYPITPHFTWEQAREMVDSGVISIQSHTYDMHQWAPYESGQARENILRWERESEDAYRQVLSQDCGLIREAITQGTGEDQVHVLAYPNGQLDPLAQVTLLENGFDILFTTQASCNTLLKGQTQSLLGLGRYNMNQAVSVEQTLEWASDARG